MKYLLYSSGQVKLITVSYELWELILANQSCRLLQEGIVQLPRNLVAAL